MKKHIASWLTKSSNGEMEIKDKVAKLLKRAGINQEALAERMDRPQSQVSRWVSNNKLPTKLPDLLLFARCLNTTVDFLIDPSLENPEGLSEDERLSLKTIRDMELTSSQLNKLIKLGLQKEKQDAAPVEIAPGLPGTSMPKLKKSGRG